MVHRVGSCLICHCTTEAGSARLGIKAQLPRDSVRVVIATSQAHINADQTLSLCVLLAFASTSCYLALVSLRPVSSCCTTASSPHSLPCHGPLCSRNIPPHLPKLAKVQPGPLRLIPSSSALIVVVPDTKVPGCAPALHAILAATLFNPPGSSTIVTPGFSSGLLPTCPRPRRQTRPFDCHSPSPFSASLQSLT